MDGEDGPRPVRDLRLDLRDVEVEGLRVDVDEDRDRTLLEDRLEGPGERVRGRDDLVARPDTDGMERRVDGGRPGVQEQRMPRADEARPLVLERRHLGSADASKDAAIEDAGHGRLVLGPDVRPDPPAVSGDRPRSAVDRQPFHRCSSFSAGQVATPVVLAAQDAS